MLRPSAFGLKWAWSCQCASLPSSSSSTSNHSNNNSNCRQQFDWCKWPHTIRTIKQVVIAAAAAVGGGRYKIQDTFLSLSVLYATLSPSLPLTHTLSLSADLLAKNARRLRARPKPKYNDKLQTVQRRCSYCGFTVIKCEIYKLRERTQPTPALLQLGD